MYILYLHCYSYNIKCRSYLVFVLIQCNNVIIIIFTLKTYTVTLSSNNQPHLEGLLIVSKHFSNSIQLEPLRFINQTNRSIGKVTTCSLHQRVVKFVQLLEGKHNTSPRRSATKRAPSNVSTVNKIQGDFLTFPFERKQRIGPNFCREAKGKLKGTKVWIGIYPQSLCRFVSRVRIQ